METIQKNISTFIESQFPAEYRDSGPVFIEFVKAYYRWMETQQIVENVNHQDLGTVSIQASNTTIIGSNTLFTDDLVEGMPIAVYRTDELYDLYTIDTISSDTVLTITEPALFTNSITVYSNTQVMYNPTYYQRRVLEFNDVDDTTDEFLVHFKNTYLTDIQFDINSDIRLLLKHTLDLYRSKGTPQAVDLLFRLVFGTDVEIYYPGDDIFKLSDGVWKKPRYIEISLNKYADVFVGLQITGQTSKATAFVEKLVRRKINGRLIDILYVSDVAGTFIQGEKLQSPSSGLDLAECPIMIGSLTGLDVDLNGVGSDYAVGDLVDVYSTNGGEAVARVSATTNTSGIITFSLIDGGYAYTANSIVYVSNNILSINTVSGTYDIYTPRYFDQFETLTQLYANVSYVAANGRFTVGSNVYSYFANGSQAGIGVVMFDGSTNTSVGSIVVSPTSGNIVANAIFSLSNTIGATVNVISGFVWANATATILNVSNNIVAYTNVTSEFFVGDNIYQQSDIGINIANGTVIRIATISGASALTIAVNDGKFKTSNLVYGVTGQGNVTTIEVDVAVTTVNSVFYVSPYSKITGAYSNGAVTSVSQGSGAGLTFSNTLLFSENVALNNTFISGYLSHPLSNATFQFPASPSGNLTSGTINSMMTYANVTIGKIATIVVAPGTGYTSAPFIQIIEPRTWPYRKLDDSFTVTAGGFTVNELITQVATGARGLVKAGSNTSLLHVQRLSWNDANNFVVTTNSTTTIMGGTSGATANITGSIGTDPPPHLGINANVVSTVTISNGAIAALDVVESGYGFIDGEEVSIFNSNTILTAFANVYTVGTGRGFYLKQGGFLSSRKKIADQFYYQNYSYDIRSSITLDKYQEMLKQVVHTAGTKLFGTFVHTAEIGTVVQFEPASVTTS